MDDQKTRPKKNKHIIIIDDENSSDEYLSDETYEEELDELNYVEKGGVYCIDFNR